MRYGVAWLSLGYWLNRDALDALWCCLLGLLAQSGCIGCAVMLPDSPRVIGSIRTHWMRCGVACGELYIVRMYTCII